MSHDSNRGDSTSPYPDGRERRPVSTDGAAADASADPRDAAARRIGFQSYAALVKASTPIAARDGRVHMIVEGHDGRWLVWREETWPEYQTFDSIHHAGRAAGEGAS